MATETRKSTAAIAPFGLRMQPDLRERVEAAAEAAGRSLNAEIVSRLEDSFTVEANQTSDALHRYGEAIAKAAAADAAIQAIDAVLSALNAPEGTSDAERFRILTQGTIRARDLGNTE